jgi:hypothetical protein
VSYTLPAGVVATPSCPSGSCSCTSSCSFAATTSLATLISTDSFNTLLASMRYRPGGTNFSQSLANRSVVLTAEDTQLRTVLTVVFTNPNLRPTVSITTSSSPSNDLQPMQRVVIFDDDRIITGATVVILNTSVGGSPRFTYSSNPLDLSVFSVATEPRGANGLSYTVSQLCGVGARGGGWLSEWSRRFGG